MSGDDAVRLRSDEKVGGDVAAKGRVAMEGESEAREVSGDVDSVVVTLEELRLGMEEPELEEEQLNANDQLQEDEVRDFDGGFLVSCCLSIIC